MPGGPRRSTSGSRRRVDDVVWITLRPVVGVGDRGAGRSAWVPGPGWRDARSADAARTSRPSRLTSPVKHLDEGRQAVTERSVSPLLWTVAVDKLGPKSARWGRNGDRGATRCDN